MDIWICTLIVGIGATIVMDIWSAIRKRLFGIPAPNYGLVGRWFAYMPRGQFRHQSIASAAAVPGERALGWAAHYATGIAFAAILLCIWGLSWIQHPTIGPALMVGLGTVAAPFLLMQPGMGAGVASRLTSRPAFAQVQSLITHSVFGLGLYLSAWPARFVYAYF